MSDEDEELPELEKQIAALQRRRAELNREVQRWKSERERFNESARTLRTEALKHREARDQANQRTAEIRREIESIRIEVAEKRGRTAELDAGLENERRRLPPRQDVEERLRRIEWEMMTTPTTDILDREKALIDEAKELKEALAVHKELEAGEEKKIVMMAEVKAAGLKIRSLRDEIPEFNDASQANHEKMILLHRKADEERRRGDEAHSKFLECLQKVRTVDAELSEVLSEAGRLREKLRESERRAADEREQRLEERKQQLLEVVKHKLEAGEKLSLDELKLLYGDEEEEAQP